MDKLGKGLLTLGSSSLLSIVLFGVYESFGPISISVDFGDNGKSIEEKIELKLVDPELNCNYIIDNNSYIAKLDSLTNENHSEESWKKLTFETVEVSDRSNWIMQIPRVLHPETGVIIEYHSKLHFKADYFAIDHKTYRISKVDCPASIDKLVVGGYLTSQFKRENLRLDSANKVTENYRFGNLLNPGFLIVDSEISRIEVLDPNLLN